MPLGSNTQQQGSPLEEVQSILQVEGCRWVSPPSRAHLSPALCSSCASASRDGGEFLQQQLLAQRVESKVLPHVDADGPNLMETKQDILAKGCFLAPGKHSNFDAAQHEAVMALEDLLQPVLCIFCIC